MLDEIFQYVSVNCIQRIGNKETVIGIAGMKQHLFLKKNLSWLIHQYEVGDYVISKFIMWGTHQGEFLKITSTNKVLEINGINIDKVIAGKIVEHSGAANTFETFFENQYKKIF